MKSCLNGRTLCALAAFVGVMTATAQVNVTQHHNHATRDGLYIDPAFTTNSAAALKRDLSFAGTIHGNVFAQPLYIEGGPSGRAMVIAVTESNNVYALDASSGKVIWQVNVGPPVSLSKLPCGNIDPLGITGTPIVDLPSRSLLFDAMTSPDGGNTTQHKIYSLNVDTGATNSGWPVDANSSVQFGTNDFSTNVFASAAQGERGALAILGSTVYIPYGGAYGDCLPYNGWIVGVVLTNPASVTAWSTTAAKGGSWSVGGVVSDGSNVFLATGNTFGAAAWGGGEAIIRFQGGPVFSGLTNDYWSPTNWMHLDSGDTDLGGSGPLILDISNASPSKLAVALGKDGNMYLLNRTNLGGISLPLAQLHVSGNSIIQAAATYQTSKGVYVVLCGNATNLVSVRITPANPPTLAIAWTVSQDGRGSPFVTSTDGTNSVIVWGIGSEGDQRLHGFDGDTGAVIYSGGGANELMSATRRFNTAIVARGRIYVANDNRVYAFSVPVPPIVLTNSMSQPDGTFQFGFTNTPGLAFTAYSSTNVTLPFANWTTLGGVSEVSPGQFQFTDSQATTNVERFYRVSSP
jgi:outer membrane protein assembly factor BamB